MERLNLRLPRGLNSRLNHFIPPGIKSEVLRLVLEALIRDFEERGRIVIGEILDSRYEIKTTKEGVVVKRR